MRSNILFGSLRPASVEGRDRQQRRASRARSEGPPVPEAIGGVRLGGRNQAHRGLRVLGPILVRRALGREEGEAGGLEPPRIPARLGPGRVHREIERRPATGGLRDAADRALRGGVSHGGPRPLRPSLRHRRDRPLHRHHRVRQERHVVRFAEEKAGLRVRRTRGSLPTDDRNRGRSVQGVERGEAKFREQPGGILSDVLSVHVQR
mmetsp:Transcript_26211/g.55726  ORF Transcript_26211/g.55726 Transcript_26211/m.55726 type:complete len:206 (-) Transcript_26211:550-1167(-)